MPFGGPDPETRRESVEELRGQRDFRHQDQRLAARSKRFRDGLEIDLRLARAGDALEQKDPEGFGSDRADQRLGGGLLIGLQRPAAELRIGSGRDRLGRQFDRFQRAVVDQTVDDAGPASRGGGQRRLRDRRGGSRAARTRERATVGRSGVLPVLRKPHFGGGAAVASGARTAMRSTPPRGARVQRATQSMKSRNGWRSAGQSRTSTIDLRLSPPPARVAQTTPVAIRVPSGTATNCPGSSRKPAGTR